jgi:hypothetical protein
MGNLTAPPKPSATIEPDSSIGNAGEGKKKNVYDDLFAKAKNKNKQNAAGQPGGASSGKDDILSKVPARQFDNTPTTGSLDAGSTVSSRGGSNTWLILAAVLVVFLTLGAGAYYYFFMYSSVTDSNSEELSQDTEILEEDEPEPVEEPEITKGLQLSDPLELSVADPLSFKDDLVEFVENQEAAGADLTEGVFIKIVTSGGKSPSNQVLQGLELNLGNLDESVGGDTWIFVTKDSLSGNPKVSLIFSLASGVSEEDVYSQVSKIETQLPEQMRSLFMFQGIAPSVPSQPVFQESYLSSSVRFFNYTQGDPSDSVDWGTVDYQGEDLLFFSTSKSSTSMILNKVNMDQGASSSSSGNGYSEEEERVRAASFCKGESLSYLSDKLRACEPMTCNFDHMMTGDSMQREIVGMVGGKCQYKKETPGGGELICNYDENLRKRAADYYWKMINADNVSSSTSSDGESIESKTTIDGEVVDDPLNEALESGACEVKTPDF